MKLSSTERKNKILHEVITKKEVSINELAELLNVTTETIRKDVNYLDKKNIISKKHGSVTMINSFAENEFNVKELDHLESKIKLSETALKLIPKNSAILLDTSTTTLQLAKLLVMRNDLTIVTNSLQIGQVLANSDNQILMTGGIYRKKSNSYVGDWALKAIHSLNVDIAFIGCDGFSNTGPTLRSYQELEIKEAIISNSKKSIILSDSSKLFNEGLYTFAKYTEIDMVIMERKLDSNERHKFSDDTLFFND